MHEPLKIIEIGQRCRFLRSKGMFINSNEPGGESVVGHGHFWCGRNQRIYGPDEQLCSDELCRNHSRSCFETL